MIFSVLFELYKKKYKIDCEIIHILPIYPYKFSANMNCM